ncbi:hypothetical protein ASF83_08935 [Plantibacter sp. Leaf171]|uniref:hypothetical protein n=1 Tax=unclassified Plantibacter TaxID=2624265 RepID=UPI0006FEA090|nr:MULTISPECIES: hypothetical protein [unclassified Plantibacter]KQM16013.1 hypothetical protein ASE44_08950 [Plantibacter sp. Leaf1]KQR59153.1 hypothetical protein ASF83_08935 [Plantibacter sp. Leaf171]
MTERWARVARGTAAAAFATFAAALSHTIGGAAAPSAFVLLVGGTFAVLVCVLLAGRRITVPGIVASVLVSQLGYHALFTLVPSTVSATVTSGGGSGAGSWHRHQVVELAAGGGITMHSHGATAMWVAHLVAAVATITAILFAERATRAALAALTVRLLARRAAPVHLVPAPRRVQWVRVNERPRNLGVVLLHLRHRGPPAFATA